MVTSPAVRGGTGRRDQILVVAAQLFAKHGFHGVSIIDLGAAVGVSGPALYRHFPGKEAVLAEMLIGISEHLLAGGRARAAASEDPREVLAALVGFQADFARREPELIVVQERDLANLPPLARRQVRQLQRRYVEIWVDTVQRVNPGLPVESARIAAHGAFGLLNSTPHSGRGAGVAVLLERMALVALTDLSPAEAPS
ncbi:MAG: SACE_7040 family transcriptional regulator [Pseudonocardia sp.]